MSQEIKCKVVDKVLADNQRHRKKIKVTLCNCRLRCVKAIVPPIMMP